MTQPLLSGQQEYADEPIDPAIAALHERIDALEERLAVLGETAKRDAVVIVLNLLGQSLREIASGKFDISVPVAPATTSTGKWEAIKQRNPGRVAETIDLLLLYGPMTQAQIAANLKIDPSNVSKNVVPKLISMGLVVRRDGKIWLRE